MRKSDFFFGAIVVLVLGAANDPRDIKSNPLNYARSLPQSDLSTTSIDSATTECVLNGGGTACALFSWDSVNPIKPTGVATCCWSQRRTSVVVGAQGAETAGRISFDVSGDADTNDPGETIGCPGYTFAANETHDMIPNSQNLAERGACVFVGRYCKKQIPGAGGALVSVPCIADAECNTMTGDASVGSCLARTDAQNTTAQTNGAAYLHCRVAVNATLISSPTEK